MSAERSSPWTAARRTGTSERAAAGAASDALVRKLRRPLLAQRGRALRQLVAGKAEEFHAERGVEDRAGCAQPVVERVFGPADRVRRALRQPHRDVHGALLHLLVRHRERDETDALGLLAADWLAQQQMVLGLGHAA